MFILCWKIYKDFLDLFPGEYSVLPFRTVSRIQIVYAGAKTAYKGDCLPDYRDCLKIV